ncbi:tetratricopeptide repeat-containing diguanylate cyclase [Actinoplanes sp. CA-252034]|uniref:tetratricopeptide repeat-containing diguanylate cyclase n=1 Tax=Actinoplanes sp. CA-252034 TaxID=3239906 RepID=UPI003D977A0F
MDGRSSGTTALAAAVRELEASFVFDPAAALRCAAEAEEAGRAAGDVELELRGKALAADALLRQAETTGDATRILRTVEFRAAEHDLPMLQARVHRLLSRVAANMGDYAGQLDHALRGLELLPGSAGPRLRVMHLMALAESLYRTRSIESAVGRYQEAERVALTAEDTLFCSYVLNDLAYALFAAGRPEQAEPVMTRLLALLDGDGRAPIPPMLDTLARIQLALGRTREAVATAESLVAGEFDPEYPEAEAEAALTLAAAYHQAGATGEAQAALDRARVLAAAPALARVRANVQREQAELCATLGDFRAAFVAYKAFHEASEELSSREREAQARIRQAAFETAEARRDAESFREQSLRDPLTGLRNRRYVDAYLPSLLTGGTSVRPVTVAIVDADHFKSINDNCSHDIGDQVLIALAGLVGQAVPEDGGFTARLGGEEFLVVLAGLPREEALARVEALRVAVQDHPWQLLTGDLPVTVSIGVAYGHHPVRPSEVLSAADRNLYAAKRGGRNRVSSDAAGAVGPGPTSSSRRAGSSGRAAAGHGSP